MSVDDDEKKREFDGFSSGKTPAIMSKVKKTMHRCAVDDMVKACQEISGQIHTATPTTIDGLMAQLDVIQEEVRKLRECAADEVQHV
eukprot:1200151-Karenia_brevis.AAC.1